MRFFVLSLGANDDDKGKVFTPGRDEGKRVVAPNWAGLVQAGDLNILIDTGMHPVHIDNPAATFEDTPYEEWIIPIMTEQDTIVYQLGQIGLVPDDIDYVLNTHLHFDHCGCNYAFPNSTFLIQKDHYEYAVQHPEEFPPEYFLIPGLEYEFLYGELTLIPGMDVVRCPGHVPGLQAVVLRLENAGTLVLAMDAISIAEMITDDLWEAFWNPVLAKHSARRLSSIAEMQGGQLFYGHDPDWWEGVKKVPDFYD